MKFKIEIILLIIILFLSISCVNAGNIDGISQIDTVESIANIGDNLDAVNPVLKLADKTLGYREDNFFKVISLLASKYSLDDVVSAISEKYKGVNHIYRHIDGKFFLPFS